MNCSNCIIVERNRCDINELGNKNMDENVPGLLKIVFSEILFIYKQGPILNPQVFFICAFIC